MLAHSSGLRNDAIWHVWPVWVRSGGVGGGGLGVPFFRSGASRLSSGEGVEAAKMAQHTVLYLNRNLVRFFFFPALVWE